MPDPKLEEFTRARELQPRFFRDMQSYLRDVIQPKLDERERMIEDITALTEENRELKKKLAGRGKAEPVREQAAVS